jgi:cytochrome oxidase assembly protein ShyY1
MDAEVYVTRSAEATAFARPESGRARRLMLLILPVLAGLALSVLGVLLGNWQLGRADEKTRLQAEIAEAQARPPVAADGTSPREWAQLALSGRWEAPGTIYLDNRVHAGRPGYHVLTPLRLERSGQLVLVNRGWVPAGAERGELPAVPLPAGRLDIVGEVRIPQSKPFTLAADPAQDAVWQVLDLDAYRARSGYAVADYVVQQTSPSADHLLRDWPRPDAGIERHRGYALQWYGLAGVALVMTGIFVARNWRRRES